MSGVREWTRDGRTAVIDIQPNGTVIVDYEALAHLLRDAGFVETTATYHQRAKTCEACAALAAATPDPATPTRAGLPADRQESDRG